MNRKILIHTAFFAEAKAFIEHFKLECLQTKPYKIYAKNSIILIVSGIGTKSNFALGDIFKRYVFLKAINIGIAGCKDKNIEIGSLFCTTHNLDFIKRERLFCSSEPVDEQKNIPAMLVDMESSIFLHVAQKYLENKNIYILKVVSDHLDTKIPKKEFVWEIMMKNLKDISKVVTMED